MVIMMSHADSSKIKSRRAWRFAPADNVQLSNVCPELSEDGGIHFGLIKEVWGKR